VLRDLGDLALKVRDERSRENIREAIKCYEAGAYRAAIVNTWTAVAYDLIDKILELAAEGDAEATAFSIKFNNAQSNQNIDQLLGIEKGIIETAREKFQFIDIAEEQALARLRDDRHKCAHPAFVVDDRIFQPSDELARYYIALALDSVLTKPPVFGKVILDKYGAAFKNNLFPAEKAASISYVKTNYLDKIRDNFLRNFTVVVAKALVKEIPQEWQGGARKHLSYTLEAVSIHEKQEWESRLRHEIIRLEETATEAGRRTFVGLMALIPSLKIGITQELKDRVKIAIESYDPTTDGRADMFLGVRIPQFKADISNAFEKLDEEQSAKVIRLHPEPSYWAKSLKFLATAASFRSAESQYDRFIKPFDKTMTKSQFLELLDAVLANGQIWDAAGTPGNLAATIETSGGLLGLKVEELVGFRDTLFERSRLATYAPVFDSLQSRGVDLAADQDCKYEDTVPF
jgi:hypothetical protein